MAKCAVCGKPEEEVSLYDGVYDGMVRKVCYQCSLDEKIALIQKPSIEQLQEADKRQSVRELMEKLSSPQKKIMKTDSAIAHKNLNKIRFPAMKQEHGDLVHNYDWIMKQRRRHMKMSTAQLAERAHADKAEIESLESGQLFAGFEKVANSIERVLDIKILKVTEPVTRIIRTPEENKQADEEMMEDVKVKMKKPWFSFFKREKKEHEMESVPEEVTVSVEAEIAPVVSEPVDFIEEDKTSPWMKVRKQQRASVERVEMPSEIRSRPINAPPKHSHISVEDIKRQKDVERREKANEMKKEIKEGKMDFSRRENLDKITLQDLADLKKQKQKK